MTVNRLFGLLTVLLVMPFFTGCHDEKLKINYELGIFPDSVMAVEGLNTQYDDYNIDIEAARLTAVRPVVFSSNRQSSGGEFDLTHGVIWYTFGQTTGFFQLDGSMEEDNFLDRLTSVFNTDVNEFGPFRFFNSRNGLEYMVVSTQTAENGLDLVYGRYIPVYSSLPVVEGPVATTVFNSSFNDAYLSLSTTLDTAYFCSDRGGNFDIYMMTRPLLINLDDWFTSSPAVPLPVDSINSGYDEKCPFVRGKYLVFASEMPGGHGGFDLWYSVFRDGKWGSPVNLGPEINSAANEYRPVLGTDLRFENNFLMFSSDRSGGRGGYDLYLTGITLPR